ncbi:cytochrome P450 [Stachybotrys elegans]|uniref:Cytochrome P450 n=1 Tax=Stachybotrys elegans TaxID=80388 RepID=A0A8K0SKF6_9HYPO|nr:cytochrome P450 [Stachybotrys elegans]
MPLSTMFTYLTAHLWWSVAAAFAVYWAAITVYRLYFHPLARYPGPKLAAASKWYEAYFDLRPHRPGTFFEELQRMHEVYGPVVRVNPDELHINDSTFVEKLYVNPINGVRNKYPPSALMIGAPDSGAGTIHHEIHRKRRLAVGAKFSKQEAATATDLIYDNVELVLKNVDRHIKERGVAEMRINWMAFSFDTLSGFLFGKPMCMLEDEEMTEAWFRTVKAVAVTTPFAKQFPWFIPTALKLPLWVINAVWPDVARIAKLRWDLDDQAAEAASQFATEDPEKLSTHREFFRTILSSPAIGAQEKKPQRIAQEAFAVMVAGNDAIMWTFATGTYYILANKERIMPRLREELLQVMPNPHDRPSIVELEQLPWFSAIIKELLRISAPLLSRLPVIAPDDDLQCGEWTIPAGTPVAMTYRNVTMDPKIFKDPEAFLPERWLSDNPELADISPYHLPFGRGSRMCVGMNVATTALHVGLAAFFRRHDFVLHDTTYEMDVKMVRDCFSGDTSHESKGVRIKYA